jgi:hypothetical protein
MTRALASIGLKFDLCRPERTPSVVLSTPTIPTEVSVKIRAGYDIAFQCPYVVPMVLMLTTHPSRDGDILIDQWMQFSPAVDARDYFDPYGNICTRLVPPPGLLEVRSEFVVEDSGLPEEVCSGT